MMRQILQTAFCLCLAPILAAQKTAENPSEQSHNQITVPGAAKANQVSFGKHVVIPLTNLQAVSSATAYKGQKISMAVMKDVMIDGVVVIPRGTPATDIVDGVEKAVPGIRNGVVSIRPVGLNLPNAPPIVLRRHNYTLEDDAMCSGFVNCLPLVVVGFAFSFGDAIALQFRRQHATGNEEVLVVCSEQWSEPPRGLVLQRLGANELRSPLPKKDLDDVCSGKKGNFIP